MDILKWVLGKEREREELRSWGALPSRSVEDGGRQTASFLGFFVLANEESKTKQKETEKEVEKQNSK